MLPQSFVLFVPSEYNLDMMSESTIDNAPTILEKWIRQGVTLEGIRFLEDHKHHLCHNNNVRDIPWFKRFMNVFRAQYKLANLDDIDYPALKKMKWAVCPADVCDIADEHNETYFTDELHMWHDRIQKSMRGEEDSDEDSDGYESDESNISMNTNPGQKRKRPRRSIRSAIKRQCQGPLHRVDH